MLRNDDDGNIVILYWYLCTYMSTLVVSYLFAHIPLYMYDTVCYGVLEVCRTLTQHKLSKYWQMVKYQSEHRLDFCTTANLSGSEHQLHSDIDDNIGRLAKSLLLDWYNVILNTMEYNCHQGYEWQKLGAFCLVVEEQQYREPVTV